MMNMNIVKKCQKAGERAALAVARRTGLKTAHALAEVFSFAGTASFASSVTFGVLCLAGIIPADFAMGAVVATGVVGTAAIKVSAKSMVKAVKQARAEKNAAVSHRVSLSPQPVRGLKQKLKSIFALRAALRASAATKTQAAKNDARVKYLREYKARQKNTGNKK